MHKKTSPDGRGLQECCANYYCFKSAVFLSLLHDLADLVQQEDWDFLQHFFFLPLSAPANVTPVTSKAAVARNINFFIFNKI
ncbi:MAG: hypothetical protein FGM46_09525 [Ferruginibacter sp.]|nr:hypothetical protein [Ferruginibacter sp.]